MLSDLLIDMNEFVWDFDGVEMFALLGEWIEFADFDRLEITDSDLLCFVIIS